MEYHIRHKSKDLKQSTEDKEREETKPKQNKETLENELQKIQKISKKSKNELTTQSVSTILTVQQPTTQEQLNLKVNRIQIKTLNTCESIFTREINTNISEDGLYVILFEYFRFNNANYENGFQHIAQIYKIKEINIENRNGNVNYETLIKSNITQIIEERNSLYKTHHPSITFNLYGQEIEFPLSDFENLIINYHHYNYDENFKFIGKGYENIELLTWIYTQIIESIKNPFNDYILYKHNQYKRNRQVKDELYEEVEQYIQHGKTIPFIKCNKIDTEKYIMHHLKNDKNNFGAYFGIFEIQNGTFKFYNNETSTTNDNNELVKQDIKLFVNNKIININNNKNFESIEIKNKKDVEYIYNIYIQQYLTDIYNFMYNKNINIISLQQQQFFKNFKQKIEVNQNFKNNFLYLINHIQQNEKYMIKIENQQMKIENQNVDQNFILYYVYNYYICLLAVLNNLDNYYKENIIKILNIILFNASLNNIQQINLMQRIYILIINNKIKFYDLNDILDEYNKSIENKNFNFIEYLNIKLEDIKTRIPLYVMTSKKLSSGDLNNEKIKLILKIVLICLIILIIVVVVIIIVKNRKSTEQFLKHKYKYI